MIVLLSSAPLFAQTLQHRYSFAGDVSDSVGGANGTLVGNAYVANGALVLPGGGNSDNPQGYVSMPNDLVTNCASITVECWLTDVAGSVWAEAWCFGNSGAGPGQPPTGGTAYISLIPHSGGNDFRAAFNLTGGDEADVVYAGAPMPLNVEEYAVLTYDLPSATASLYLNGALLATAGIPANLSPANYGSTFNNWLGRDEFGGDPMFAGSIDELRVWNGAMPPIYIAVSSSAGPNVLVTNLTPKQVNISAGVTSMAISQNQQAVVTANFLQASNVPVTGLVTNWTSSNPNVLTVSSNGTITGVGLGSATVSATLRGVTGTSASVTIVRTNRAAAITVSYWQFNNSANLGVDSGSHGNTLATGVGSPAYSSAGIFGAGALYLNGNSTMTTLSGAFPTGVPVGASPYSIAVWEKADAGNPVNGGFVSWGTENQGGCNALRLSDANNNADSVDNYWWSNDFYVDGLPVDPDDGNWHSVIATWDGTTQILYVDGTNVGSRVPTAPNVQAAAFLVGQTLGDNNQFKGWMADLLIANAAMTPADIALYQSGSWLSTSPAVAYQPTASPSSSVFAGTTLTLTESATGAAPFQYQWQKNGQNIPSANASTLVLTNVAVNDSGNYAVIVANEYGTNSSPALGVTVTLLTNLNPTSVSIIITNSTMAVGQHQQAAVTENLQQVSNYPATSSATNWTSSNPSVLTVSSSGFITAVGSGNATISATVHGVTGTSASVAVSPLPQPVAYYPLDGDVLDYSGNGNNGINSGATFISPAYVSSQAAEFNGGSYVQIPESIGTTGNGFTIAMWLQTTDTANGPNWYSGEGLVDGEMPGATTDFGTALVGGAFALGIGQPDTTLASSVSVNDGNWHHVAATWNMTNGAMNVYVDGALSASGTGPTGPRNAPPSLHIGSIQTSVAGGFLNGTIDEVRLFNTEFTAQQIEALKNSYSAAPQVGAPYVSPSNTVFAGTTVSLGVNVVGTPPYQFQWQKNGSNIAAATSAMLTLTNATVANSGTYDVIVANAAGSNTSPVLVVVISPASAPIFTQEPAPANSTNYVGGLLTLSGSVNGTLPIQLQWQHNGVNIPNATGNALTLVSLQPDAAGSYTLVASNSFGFVTSQPAVVNVLPQPNPGALNMLTYHNDNTRQGADTNEVLLTPANVNVSTFGRLMQYTTDGLTIAQPLYVYGLVIPGQGTHNAVFVATENNTVYAFDADRNDGTNMGILWQTNLGAAVSSYDNEFGNRGTGSFYPDIDPVVGITGTPVIDLASGTLYVDVHTREIGATTNYFHRIHALNITNGTEQPHSPAVVSNAFPGVGIGSSNGIVPFDAKQHLQRPGLMLAGGNLYVSFGSYADTDPYHGWVIGLNVTNLQTSASNVFCTTPNATTAAFGGNAAEGGLWMGGDGPCADASNNIYFVTGNGSFSANTNGGDYGDSFVKLSTTNGLRLADYFTPYNQAAMAANDTDLGSGGAILLPDSVGTAAHPHLMVGCGKDGTLRLVDRDNMGKFNPASDNQVVQDVPGAIAGSWSTPAYFNNQIYFQGNSDVMRAFYISNALISPTPVSKSTVTFGGFASGGTPLISANGTNNAIVWAVQSDGSGSGGAAVLHAFNATNLAQELYNSGQNFARDNPGSAIIMTTPTVMNGKVFVGTQYALSVYGNSVFVATPLIAPTGGTFTNSMLVTLTDATPNACIFYTLDGTSPTTNSVPYNGPFELTVSANVQAIAVIPGAVNSGVASASFINSAATGNGTGLLGQYFGNHSSANPFSGTPTSVQTNATINFNWGAAGPGFGVGKTNFTVRWTGSVETKYSELYTFTTLADDGVRLYINGQLLINDWTDKNSVASNGASVELAAQQLYTIELDYYQKTNNASVSLSWSSPSTPLAIVPQSQLYPFTNPPPVVVLTSPSNNSTNFTDAASVTISADADAAYNPISAVNFYANGNFLGGATTVPYTITATGLAAGSYALTAVAVDASGLSSTSAVVNIKVTSGSGLPYGMTTRAPLNAFLNMPSANNSQVPALLSGTGVFSSTSNRTPAAGLIAYQPNSPQWKDNAVSSWYMAIPNGGGVITPAQQIQFQATNTWIFPAGSVFVKNFDLVVNETNNTTRRLETEILVRDNNGSVYGANYKWRPDNSDADLLPASTSEDILITNATGVRLQSWYYAGEVDCVECHNSPVNGSPNGINVLGINTRQINGGFTYPATGISDDQLRTLNRLGLFNPAINESDISHYSQLAPMTNLSASMERRVRSYLDANCAECHQPGGQGITWDARYETPLAQQNITNYPASIALGISDGACIVKDKDIWRSVLMARINTTNQDIQMPDFRNLIDTNAVGVITDWINSLPGIPALAPPAIAPNGGNFVASVHVTLTPPDANAAIFYTLDGSVPTTNSLRYNGPFNLLNDATLSASAFEANYNNSAAGSALFLVQPLYFTGLSFLTNRQVQIGLVGAAGSNYVLQSSTDLLNWTTLSTNLAQTNSILLVAPATNTPANFYRVIQQ